MTFYDKDAPTGSGFWHWVAYDIPANITNLPGGVNGGTLPAGVVEGNTDLGKPGFFGRCPPTGRVHTYVYTVHALKAERLGVSQRCQPRNGGFHAVGEPHRGSYARGQGRPSSLTPSRLRPLETVFGAVQQAARRHLA